MTDTIEVTMPIEAADEIVLAWLRGTLKTIEGNYYKENEGAHVDDEDWQAMKRLLFYMTGVEE